jgi:hypothetical protein
MGVQCESLPFMLRFTHTSCAFLHMWAYATTERSVYPNVQMLTCRPYQDFHCRRQKHRRSDWI